MPRMKEGLDGLIEDFRKRLAAVIDAARDEGRADAVARIQRAVGSRSRRAAGTRRGRRPAKATKKTRSGKKRKNPWAGLSPEKKLERVNAIRKGRGLPPKEKL